MRCVAPLHPLEFCCTIASATAVTALALGTCSPGAECRPAWQRHVILLAQAAATYLPLLAFGIMWTGMASFLSGSALLLAPRWKAWALFALIFLGTSVAAVAARQGANGIAAAIGSPALGVVVFGLSRLDQLVRHAHAARAEVAQLAALKERARFAVDLHDLLGYSLSAIALKAEFSRRVMDTKPDQAERELADVIDFARQAVADVRQVADGYRAMSFAAEARSAASLLAAAQIAADIEMDYGLIDSKVDTVLATVLREAVTNLLRHSTAQTCRVAARQASGSITLLVANDGAPQSGLTYRDGGGLENLAARLETVGGTLTVESQSGTFVLRASVPQAVRGASRTAAASTSSQLTSPSEPTCEEAC
jgi:two-component system sensor histidine kinase DesK